MQSQLDSRLAMVIKPRIYGLSTCCFVFESIINMDFPVVPFSVVLSAFRALNRGLALSNK